MNKLDVNNLFNIVRILMIFLLLSSCQKSDNGAKEGRNESTIIKADYQKAKSVHLTELLKKVEYIPLETRSNIYLGEIADITLSDDRIYILDMQRLSVLSFSRQGSFLFEINDVGLGPGEFMNPEGIYVDNSGIFIMDRRGRKILKYSLEGEFLNEVKFEYPFFEFVIKENQIFANSRNYSTFGIDKTLHTLNMSGELKASAIPNFSEVENRPWSIYQNFYFSGADMFFIPDFTTSVFQIKNNDIELKWDIDFGHEWFSERNGKFDGNSRNFVNLYNSGKGIYGITNFAEMSDFIFFGYMLNKNGFYNFYDKRNRKLLSFRVTSPASKKMLTNKIMPREMHNGVGVHVIPSDVFLNKLPQASSVNERLADIKIGDNPIIVLTYFEDYEDLVDLYE